MRVEATLPKSRALCVTWLEQVHDIVRTIDLDCDGFVSWEEFKRAFLEPGESHRLTKVV